jgi:hypothetical protein
VPVRLLGVKLSNLRPQAQQLALFDATQPLHRVMDCVRERFGYDALGLALADIRRRRTP